MEIRLWDFLMFYQIFVSPQVKRSTIISNTHGVYELSHELLNLDLGSSEITNNQENLKTYLHDKLVSSLSSK